MPPDETYDFELESPATSPAPTRGSPTPQPTASQSQSWYEIKEIIKERPKHYKVEWEGVNPETGKPWPSEWIPKQDVTELAIKEWNQKQKEQTEKARRKKKAQLLKKRRSKENEEEREAEGEQSPTASSKKRARLPSDDEDFESDRSYTPPKRARYDHLPSFDDDDDEAQDADSEYVPSQHLVLSNPTTRSSSRSSTPTRPPPRPRSAFVGISVTPLASQIRDQYLHEESSSPPSYTTPSPPSSPHTPIRGFRRPLLRTPGFIPDSQPSQGRDIALARKATNPEIELESPRPSKKHKIPFLAAAAAAETSETTSDNPESTDLAAKLEKFGTLLGPKIPSPKIDDSIPESEIRLTVNSQFLELVNEWNEARRYRSVSYDSEYEGYFDSLSNTLESIHISDKTPRASVQPEPKSSPCLPPTSQVTHIDETQRSRHTSVHEDEEEEEHRGARVVSPASSDSSDISDITVSELTITRRLNESIRSTPTNFAQFNIRNPLSLPSSTEDSPFLRAASLPRITESLSSFAPTPREAQSELIPTTSFREPPVRVHPARQRSTSVIIKEEPEEDDPRALYLIPERDIKQEEDSEEEEFLEALEDPTQSSPDYESQPEEEDEDSNDTETFQDAQQPELFDLADTSEIFNIPLPESPALETPSDSTATKDDEDKSKNSEDGKDDKEEKDSTKDIERGFQRRASIESKKKQYSPDTSKRRPSFPSRPTGEHLTRIADLPIARGKEKKGTKFAEELGTLPVNSKIDSWFGKVPNNMAQQQRKVLVLPTEAQLAEMARNRDAGMQEARLKIQQEMANDEKKREEDFNRLLSLFTPQETSISLPTTPVQGIKRDPRNSVPPSQEVLLRKPTILVDGRNPTYKEMPEQQDIIYLGLHMTGTQAEHYKKFMVEHIPILAHFLASESNEAYFETQLSNIRERSQKLLNDPCHVEPFDVETISEQKYGQRPVHANSKFYFLNELFKLIRNANIHVVIASGYEKVRLILEAYLREKEISCSPLGRHSVFPAEPVIDSPVKVSIVPTAEDPRIQIASAQLVIAMDDTFDLEVKHISQAREQKLYDSGLAPVLKLFTFNSFEHLTPFYGIQRSADLTSNFREYWQIASTTFLSQGVQPTYDPTAKDLAAIVSNWLQNLTSGRWQSKPEIPAIPALMLRRLRIENARPESAVFDVFRQQRLQSQMTGVPLPYEPEPIPEPVNPIANMRSPVLSPNPHALTLHQRPDAEIWEALERDVAEGRKRRRNNDDDERDTSSATKKARQAGMAPVNTGGEEEVYDENFDYSQLSKEELIYCLRVEYARRQSLKGAVEQMQATYEEQKRQVREANERNEKLQQDLNRMKETLDRTRVSYDTVRNERNAANREVKQLKDVIEKQNSPDSPVANWLNLKAENQSLKAELDLALKRSKSAQGDIETFKNYYHESQARAAELSTELEKVKYEKEHVERRVGAQDQNARAMYEFERRKAEMLNQELTTQREVGRMQALRIKDLEDKVATVAISRPRRG